MSIIWTQPLWAIAVGVQTRKWVWNSLSVPRCVHSTVFLFVVWTDKDQRCKNLSNFLWLVFRRIDVIYRLVRSVWLWSSLVHIPSLPTEGSSSTDWRNYFSIDGSEPPATKKHSADEKYRKICLVVSKGGNFLRKNVKCVNFRFHGWRGRTRGTDCNCDILQTWADGVTSMGH